MQWQWQWRSGNGCLTHHTPSPADKAWRLWDPRGRSADGAVVLRAFHSHRGWVSGVAWSPASEHLLLTTSFDGAAKLWDIR